MLRLLALVLCSLLPSCAAMFQGGPEHVPIDSEPRGAVVKLDGKVVGTTPCTVAVRRSSYGLVSIELPGHSTQDIQLDTAFNGWMLANIVFPGLLGILIDAISGNSVCWSEQSVWCRMTLAPESRPASRPDPRRQRDCTSQTSTEKPAETPNFILDA